MLINSQSTTIVGFSFIIHTNEWLEVNRFFGDLTLTAGDSTSCIPALGDCLI